MNIDLTNLAAAVLEAVRKDQEQHEEDRRNTDGDRRDHGVLLSQHR